MSDRQFSVNLQVTRKSTESFNDYFTLDDQAKWDTLREHASKILKKSALAKYPKIAPHDPQLWFELYRYFPEDLYENQDEDLGSDQPDQVRLVLLEDDEQIDSYTNDEV